MNIKIAFILENAKLSVVILNFWKLWYPLESQSRCLNFSVSVVYDILDIICVSIFSLSVRNLEPFGCSRVNHSLYINITHLNSWVPSLCLMYVYTSAHSNFQARLCHEQNRRLQAPQVCHSMAEATAVAPYLIWECTIWKISYWKRNEQMWKIFGESVFFKTMLFFWFVRPDSELDKGSFQVLIVKQHSQGFKVWAKVCCT